MRFDADRGVGQRQHLRVLQTEARAFGGLGRHVQRAGGDMSGGAGQPHLLLPQRASQHRAMTLLKGRLMHEELVRIDGALHDVLAQTVGAGDEDDVAKTGFGIECEDHAAAGAV